MSQNTDSPKPSINLVNYEDISGEFMTKPDTLSPITSTATLDAVTEKEDELDTDTDTDTDTHTDTQTVNKDEGLEDVDTDTDMVAGLYGPLLLVSGLLLAGLAIFLNQPMSMDHPWSRNEYF